jgi:peptidyl-prolyl cis-trans isomerase C
MRAMLKSALVVVLATSATLAGCNQTPTGQVVAIVNGEEISLQELNAELEGLNVPPSADKKLVRKQLLQQIVDRRLLAQTAKAYITQQRRMNEELLVRMYGKKAADTIRVPDAAAVDKFIAANPAMFTQRTRYKVDQIQFPMPADASRLKALEAAHSLADVSATLTKMGIKFERGVGAIDSGTVPEPMLKQILALPPGEPFVVPVGDRVVVSVITGSEPLLVKPEQARPLAVQAMRNQNLSKIGETRLNEAKAKAKIEYQPGYEPPAKPAKPAAAK